MAAGQAAMEAAIGLTPEHIDALSLTAEPKGVRAADLGPAQRDLLRALLDVYVRRVPDELADAESAKYASDDGARRAGVRLGRRAARPASRTTTACRVAACSPSTTTPSAA